MTAKTRQRRFEICTYLIDESFTRVSKSRLQRLLDGHLRREIDNAVNVGVLEYRCQIRNNLFFFKQNFV